MKKAQAAFQAKQCSKDFALDYYLEEDFRKLQQKPDLDVRKLLFTPASKEFFRSIADAVFVDNELSVALALFIAQAFSGQCMVGFDEDSEESNIE